MYKAFVTVPKSGGKVKTRELGTRDVAEAIILKSEFAKELKANNYQTIKEPKVEETSVIDLSIEPQKLNVVKEFEYSRL